LTIPHAGLEISDDAFRCIEYKRTVHGLEIAKYAETDVPPGLIDGGEVKDEKKFSELLHTFVHENKLTYVKVSLPEEKVYLFQMDIPSVDVRAVTQHVEFKLEENVPLSAVDSVFYFDILPAAVTGNLLRASVSVVPRSYVEKMISILHGMGLVPIAFEVAPKSLAKALVKKSVSDTYLIIHVMNRKTGTYIVSGGVVCFSSTLSWGTRQNPDGNKAENMDISALSKEIHRVYEYWATRPDAHSTISQIMLVGEDAQMVEEKFHRDPSHVAVPLASVDVWQNAFDIHNYIPNISREESLEYAVAAGLALP